MKTVQPTARAGQQVPGSKGKAKLTARGIKLISGPPSDSRPHALGQNTLHTTMITVFSGRELCSRLTGTRQRGKKAGLARLSVCSGAMEACAGYDKDSKNSADKTQRARTEEYEGLLTGRVAAGSR